MAACWYTRPRCLASSMTTNDSTEEKFLGPTPADVPLDYLPTRELTDEQFERAKDIARARSRSYEQIEGGQICGDQTNFDAHLTGTVGEVAFAVETGSHVDDTVYQDGDDGYDFRFGALTIDTKTTATHVERPSLLVPVEPTPTANLYFFLHRIDTRTVRFIGFATRFGVTDRTPVREPGDILNYVIPQNELWLPPGIEAVLADDSLVR